MKKHELALCLFLGFGTALTIKACYGNAGSDELLWILAPTAWWARVLGGLAFTYEPGVGYVNHTVQFIIAPSCAGVRFLTISLMMLTGSFVFRMRSLRQGLAWTAGSTAFAWLYTGFVNGIRMVLSVKLPPILERTGIGSWWLTWERLHTIIGTAVYFTALLVLYRLGEYLAERMTQSGQVLQKDQILQKEQVRQKEQSWQAEQPERGRIWRPVLWYVLPVLAIPLLNRILRQNYQGFAEYALLVGGVCLTLLAVIFVFRRTRL